MEKRNLDGIYFRVLRDGKWDNICFSDLTPSEMDGVLANRNIEWLKQLCVHIGLSLQYVGKQYNISNED